MSGSVNMNQAPPVNVSGFAFQEQGDAPSGMYAAMAAFLESIDAITTYNNGLMSLSETVTQLNETIASTWMTQLNGDEANVQTISNTPVGTATGDYATAQDKANALNGATSAYNMDNTSYNNANTYLSGMGNATNQNSSDTTQTIQIDLQMYSQGPQSQIQNTIQCL